MVIEELKLENISVINARAEEYSKENREKYDVVTSRAVAPLKHLLEYSIPLLKINGIFLALKSNIDEEIKNIENYHKKLFLQKETIIKFEDEAGLCTALKQMLDEFSDGILVRYEGYPHTMMAVGYEGDTIYFNDPGVAGAEHVPFDKTCLNGYSLCDISYVQAVRTTEGE